MEISPHERKISGPSQAPKTLGNVVTGPLSIAPAVNMPEYHLTLPWRHAMHRRAAGSSTARSKGQDEELPRGVGRTTNNEKVLYTVRGHWAQYRTCNVPLSLY